MSPPPRVDQTDLEILKYLVDDARLSQRAIARAIGMSAPAVADRIARLEAVGVLKGYRAQVDYALLDRGLTIIVGITSERSAAQRELAQSLLEIPEVQSVDVVTGSLDLQVRLRVRDQSHLNEVFFDRLLRFPGIRHTDSALALYTYEPDNFAHTMLSSLSNDGSLASSLTDQVTAMTNKEEL